MGEPVVRVHFQFVPDKGNAAVSQEILSQVEALKKKCEDIGTIQIKALGGAGELAGKSVEVIKNIALLGTSSEESSKKVEAAFGKIEKVIGTFKGSVEILKAANEELELLRNYSAIGSAALVKKGGTGTIAPGGEGAISAGSKAAGEAAGKLGETGSAAVGLTLMLKGVGTKLAEAAVIVAPFAAAAAATVAVYEGIVHVLGWIGAIDVSSASLLESYRGWEEATEAAAKSTKEIAIQEELRKTRSEHRKGQDEQTSAALDERYKLVDASRRHYELMGLGSGKNRLLPKFDEFELVDQQHRAAVALAGAEQQRGKQEVAFTKPMTPDEEKEHEKEAPGFWAGLGYEIQTQFNRPAADKAWVERKLLDVLHFHEPARVIQDGPPPGALPDSPARKYLDEEAKTHGPHQVTVIPDYTTALKEYERLEHLQERALATSKAEYDVLRDKSKELQGQVLQSEELLRQAHARVGVEQNRSESAVADFARLTPDVRTKAVSIAAEYEKTGKLSLDRAAFLDQHNLARGLTDQTFAASMGDKERHALRVFGAFRGVDEAKEAERKASEALTKAKQEEAAVTKEMAKLKQNMLRQDDAAFGTTQLISFIKEHIGALPHIDRTGLAGNGAAKEFSKSVHPAEDAVNRATQIAIQNIKALGDASKQKMEELKAAEAALPQAVAGYRRAIDAAFEKDVLPAITGSIRRLGSLITTST